MAKSGKMKRKRKRKNSQVEPKPKAVAPVSGAGKNRTLAACSRRPRTVDEYSSFNSSIPREVMYHILLLLPASVLQEIVRFVCKEWNSIITDPLFIRAHLLHSLSSPATTGFLIQDQDLHDAKLKRAFYLHPYDHATSKLKLPFQATILGSCNGLLLLQNAIIPQELFVVNLVTKANISLPPVTLAGLLVHHKPSTALAFASFSGQYKVLYVSYVSKNERAPYVNPGEASYYCARFEVKVMVCTIAVDKTWRTIDFQGITMSNDAKETLMSQPFSSAGGYICWFHKHHAYGFALDIDAETMYQFAGPEDYVTGCNPTCSIPMDTGVCMVHFQSPSKCWKIWEMIEPKTGTWGRCINFDAAGMYSAIDRHFNPSFAGGAIPLLISLKTGELWLFCGVESRHDYNFALVCYNWKTGSIWSPPIKWPRRFALPHLHVNSLLSLKNL